MKNVVARFLNCNASPTEAPGAVVGAFVVFYKNRARIPSIVLLLLNISYYSRIHVLTPRYHLVFQDFTLEMNRTLSHFYF